MPHDGGERFGISAHVLLGAGGKLSGVDARSVLATWEPRPVGLYPCGHVSTIPVLPRRKPDENQLQVMLSSTLEQIIHQREIEFPFLGFDQFPRDAGNDSVQVQFG